VKTHSQGKKIQTKKTAQQEKNKNAKKQAQRSYGWDKPKPRKLKGSRKFEDQNQRENLTHTNTDRKLGPLSNGRTTTPRCMGTGEAKQKYESKEQREDQGQMAPAPGKKNQLQSVIDRAITANRRRSTKKRGKIEGVKGRGGAGEGHRFDQKASHFESVEKCKKGERRKTRRESLGGVGDAGQKKSARLCQARVQPPMWCWIVWAAPGKGESVGEGVPLTENQRWWAGG